MQAQPQLKLEGDLLFRPLHLPDGLHLPIETYIPAGARLSEQISSSGSKNEARFLEEGTFIPPCFTLCFRKRLQAFALLSFFRAAVSL